jgi:two-component system LytT family response regulator
MNKIKVILIDDEEKALEGLQLKVNRFFPEIDIIKTISSPEEAIIAINSLKPDLVFIDIEMPVLSGFDVLAKIDNPNFEIIFVTAYNNYAIEAIQHCAIGYVVKPIDNDELKQAVNNALKNINHKTSFEKNVQLLERLGSNSSQTSIAIPTQKGLSFIKTKNIIRFEGVDGYTKIYIENEKSILSSYSIGKFSKMLDDSEFYLCHKSHLINLKYVTFILKEGSVLLQDKSHVPLVKAKRNELVEKMQNL